MSAVQQFLLTVEHNDDKASEIARDSAKALESRKTTLIEFVQSLGEYINDEETTKRARTIDYLTRVIGELSPKYLSRQQTQVLCQFLCDRIEDGGAVGGLKSLHLTERFNGGMAVLTFRAINEHFQDLQLRPQLQRLQVLDLLSGLLLRYRKDVEKLGDEAIVGITDLVSGEKDPRNLMVVFSILKVIMVEWDIAGHAETLFDSVFCYFPITFRPPPGDPYGITAQDLKTRLRDCIAASGYFAPYAFPQLLDKLDSTSPNVKKDILQTIAACASSYGLTTISNYSVTLWDSLKYEILNVQEEILAEESLRALQSIAVRLGRDLESTDPKTPLATFIRPITKECNEQLQEPQHKQAKPAGQILSAISIASPHAFHLVARSVFPSLSTLYQDAEIVPKQRALLEVLVQLLDSSITVYGTLAILAPETNLENPLTPFKDRLFELTSQALMAASREEISFRVVALKALLRLCILRKYLQENEIGMVVQYLNEIILDEDSTGRDDLKQEAVRALVEISRLHPQLIMNITFPAFMARLPDSSPPLDHDYLITLEGLAQLSVDRFVADTLIRRLLNRLDSVLDKAGAPSYPQAILSTLHYVLSRRDLSSDINLQFYLENIVVALTTRAVHAASGKTRSAALSELPVLETLGRLIVIVVRALDRHKQQSVALQCYTLFIEDGTFQPVLFRHGASSNEMSTMILSTAIMAGVAQDAKPQFTDDSQTSAGDLLSELVRMATAEEVPAIRQAILRQTFLIANKFMTSKAIECTTWIIENLVSGLVNNTTSLENKIRALFWISKALILRSYKIDESLERLLTLLSDNIHGSAVAQGFSLLLSPDEMASKENGATMRLLARQKVFSICVPKIAEAFRHAESFTKPNFLIAISGILKYMPTEVTMQGMDTLLPLLLQSLQLEEPDVKAATIQTLTIVSQESPATIETHISTMVTQLLRATADPQRNNQSVRLNALRCLESFPGKIKDSTLLPYKSKVIRGLINSLDDPKRDVRKEAVDCRAVWSNMDEPDSD
ncbi:uncharacterized protein KY384_004189 [Bacidia gigantensis]|uniref:uncharacterized protein n=1 Tax=Bacidia gigantensis TaxID=2732470 RepID=UPI001D04F967|nr:uncharacterized protein KY384_004189 [Bacidia gigantensis]KAG8530832.1 hypothetical protein KY384_004189 [Bacidia gigantensis]